MTIILTCPSGGNICIEIYTSWCMRGPPYMGYQQLIVHTILFPNPGTRTSNHLSHEISHSLEYLHHRNLQVHPTSSVLFPQSRLLNIYQHTTECTHLVCVCCLNYGSSWSRLNLVTFTKVRENFAHTMAPGRAWRQSGRTSLRFFRVHSWQLVQRKVRLERSTSCSPFHCTTCRILKSLERY